MKTFSFLKRWNQFCKERFSIISHLLLISALYSANSLVTLNIASDRPALSMMPILVGFMVVFLTFLRLRIFDEIKDYSHDCSVNPSRPLARGLISLKEAKWVTVILVFIELFLSLKLGINAVISWAGYTLFSFLMYKEFFIGTWLRTKLATYAMSHTLISSFIALYIFSVTSQTAFYHAPLLFWLFAFANWMIFNVFEFGRKTFGNTEERKDVDSYSKNFGPLGSVICVISMALAAITSIEIISYYHKWPFIISIFEWFLLLILIFFSFLYAKTNSAYWAVKFRKASMGFIFCYNLIITIGLLLL